MRTIYACYIAMLLTASGQALWTNYSRAQEPTADEADEATCDALDAIGDGQSCRCWLRMLQEDRNETVDRPLEDTGQPKIKLLRDGEAWRLVLLAGSEKPLYGCVIASGVGVLER